MKRTFTMIAVVAGLAVTTVWAQGPMGMGGPQGGPDSKLAKIFGRNASFSATIATTIVSDKGEQMATESTMAMLDGKVRHEMDLTKFQGGKGRQPDMATLKQMGMDRNIIIARPDKRVTYMVYPGMKAYVEMPMKDTAEKADAKPPKVERVELGKETVDGHPCIKTKRIITEDSGEKFESLVWEATDLAQFPVQTQHQTDHGSVTALFKNINRAKPDAALFEVPEGYKKYSNMMEMMMGGAMPRGGGKAAPGGEE